MNMVYKDNPIVGYYDNGMAVPVCKKTAGSRPIFLFDSDGRRIYRHSLSFLFCYACHLALPERAIIIGHSLGDGFYFTFKDEENITDIEINRIRKKMSELVSQSLDITYTSLSYKKALVCFEKQGMNSTAKLLNFKNEPDVAVYKINDYYDVAYEPLIPNTSLLSVWEVKKYTRKGLLLRFPISTDIMHIQNFIDNPCLFKVFDEYKKWGKILNVSCAGDLNKVISENGIQQYIRLSEALHRRKLADVADMIAQRKSSAVFIAGPSSSGKTTFSVKLCEQLMLMGFKPIRISLDNYYKERTEIPKNKNGEIDYECLEALHLNFFKRDMQKLYKGEKVSLPIWNFSKQERTYQEKIEMSDKTVFVIEGIHALNPEVTDFLQQKYVFKIYISALTQLNLDDHNRISTTDNRILRRILRDYRTRNTSAEETFRMWDSVQSGERKHIFPYQNFADVNFNSASDYELSVIAPLVIPLLKMIKPNCGVPYSMARRLLAFLDNFYPIPADMVPGDSILREFIGGSDYGVL